MWLRKLLPTEMDEAARIHRAAFEDRLPWLPCLHTPEEDRNYYRGRIFRQCEVWGAEEAAAIKGFIAFHGEWIDQFYVLPEAQRRGFGSALLAIAKAASPRLRLWTFQRNLPARRFYEARGFVLVKETDGSDNEEREPDALYVWTRPMEDLCRVS